MIISALLMFVGCVVLLIIWAKSSFWMRFLLALAILRCDFIDFFRFFAFGPIFCLIFVLAFFLSLAVGEKRFGL